MDLLTEQKAILLLDASSCVDQLIKIDLPAQLMNHQAGKDEIPGRRVDEAGVATLIHIHQEHSVLP